MSAKFHFLLSLCFIVILSACNNSKFSNPEISEVELNGEKIEFDAPDNDFSGYLLNGVVKDQKSGTLYLDFLTLTEVQTIDTTQIQSNGSFQFQGNLSEKGFYRIRYADKISWVVILDNGTGLLVKLNTADLADLEVKGDAENAQFKALNDDMYQRQFDLQKLYEERATLLQGGAGNMEKVRVIESQITSAAEAFGRDFRNYTDTCQKPFLALYSSTFLNPEYNFEFLDGFTKKLEAKLPNSTYTKQFKTRMDAARSAMEAAKAKPLDLDFDKTIAPDFSMNDVNGKAFKLSSLRGKWVLLDFWASWCGPCRRENPTVVAAYNKFKDKGFTILSVSLDDNAENWKAAIAKDGLSWPYHVCDFQKWNNAAAQMYGIQAIPANFVIDPDGYIVGKDLRGEALETFLKEYIK